MNGKSTITTRIYRGLHVGLSIQDGVLVQCVSEEPNPAAVMVGDRVMLPPKYTQGLFEEPTPFVVKELIIHTQVIQHNISADILPDGAFVWAEGIGDETLQLTDMRRNATVKLTPTTLFTDMFEVELSLAECLRLRAIPTSGRRFLSDSRPPQLDPTITSNRL